MYSRHLFPPLDLFYNQGVMRPFPAASSYSDALFSPLVTITLLVLSVLLQSAAASATPQLTCSPAGLRFGNVVIGQSKSMPVVLNNSGPTSLTISGLNSGLEAFEVSGLSLPVTIAPGNSVSFTVAFTPTTTGLEVEAISIVSKFSASSFCTEASGRGGANRFLTPSPTSLGFGNVSLGSTSTLPVVLTNSGRYSLTFSQEQTTGAGFTISGLNLPVSLQPNQSFTFNVLFTPQSTGTVSGSVNLTGTGVTIPLTATGTSTAQLTITPAALSYGSVDVGASATQNVTLSAIGTSVTISSGATSNSQFVLEGTSFPVTIAAGKSSSFSVAFTPQASGTISGTLSFASSAPNSPLIETTSGVGAVAPHSVGLSWNASTSSNITGYNLYRAIYASSCGAFSKINSAVNAGTTYTDSTVAGGTTYCYASTAINSSNEESGYSNEAQVTVE
jgi:hypothetical protein